MKRTALMISTLCLMASQMASAQVMTAQDRENILVNIAKERDAKLTGDQVQALDKEIQRLSKLDNRSLKEEGFVNSLQKHASCRAGDILIIANGVAEGVPVIATATREVNANYLYEVNPMTADFIKDNRMSWKNLFGILASLPDVVIEAVSTGIDKKEIEKEIQKTFPGTQMLAVKLQGEASFCGQKTLKGDIIDALKKARGI